MTVIKLDAGAITAYYTDAVKRAINKALPILLEELKRLTPEDTKEMLNSYVVQSAEVQGDKIVGVIGNTSKHAIYVEYGRSGLTFDYHKPKGTTFYSGIGNRTFARAVDNVRQKIIDLILSELK